MTSPCTWPVDRTCLPIDGDPDALQEAIDTAVAVLWALTGRQYGVCPTEVRPCPPSSIGSADPCRDPAETCHGRSILLPGPVHRLLGVTVDGEEVDPTSFVTRGDHLYRCYGLPWPQQHLDRPDGAPGTWVVTYERGVPPPAGAAHAVGALAREFYAACHGGRCQLPRRTRQVQRQGVTVTMVDPEDIYASGATGITEVDLWIRAVNPHRLSEPTTVWSPEKGVW